MRPVRHVLLAAFAVAVTVFVPPAAAQEDSARIGFGERVMTLRTTTDIAILRPAVEAFLASRPGLSVAFEQWGSNALYDDAQAACAAGQGMADAVFTSGVHQALALVNAGCAQPYRSDATGALPPARQWRDELWGVTEEPAVIIYNRALLAPEDVPRTRFALLDLMRGGRAEAGTPDLRGRIATYDIEASGLGFLFAHADSLEATTFGQLLEGLGRTGAVATCCSAAIIRAVAEGRFVLAYNVLGSYAAFAAPPEVGVVLPEDYTLFLSRAYMIPKGASNPEAAAAFLDFLLSAEGQAILARAGLVHGQGPEDSALAPGARRTIALAPPLLVALDDSTTAEFRRLWQNIFAASILP